MAKARRRLSDLVQEETQKVGEQNLQTSEVTKIDSLPETSKTPDSVEEVTEQQTFDITDLQSTELPKYLKLERKEARLRQDQIDGLTDLTRKLNRMKRGKGGERLTDNTLIRVAVDLLLSKASDLKGTTEEELRDSLDL